MTANHQCSLGLLWLLLHEAEFTLLYGDLNPTTGSTTYKVSNLQCLWEGSATSFIVKYSWLAYI